MLPKTAVHTYFLFGRLFHMIRGQFSHLTREACNYLGEDYKIIASHFLVTTELLLSQFQLPKIYIDAEMVWKWDQVVEGVVHACMLIFWWLFAVQNLDM